MQWLIDIIVAASHADFGYYDRGDAPAWDFSRVDFIIDNTWRVLDLSAIVPAGAIAVYVLVQLRNVAVAKSFTVRRNGNAFAFNSARVNTQTANVTVQANAIVHCDADRKIEYKIAAGGWTVLNMFVCGWWLR